MINVINFLAERGKAGSDIVKSYPTLIYIKN